MPHAPICVVVPGTQGSDELSLTPKEAALLIRRLERELARWTALLEETGNKGLARQRMERERR